MNIILLGAAGSGKGTQAEYISTKYNLKKIATGDLLRAEIAKKTELGNRIKSIVQAGSLVDTGLIVRLVLEKLQSTHDDSGAIFDGFPRTVMQAQILDDMLTEQGQKIDIVIELVVSEEDLVRRLSNRYHCAKCNAGYNRLFRNPKIDNVCDVCQSKEFIVREDDKPEAIRKRFDDYQTQTGLLLPYYEKKGLLSKINGQEDMKNVSENIDLIIKQVIGY
jgi:adenylate kinase